MSKLDLSPWQYRQWQGSSVCSWFWCTHWWRIGREAGWLQRFRVCAVLGWGWGYGGRYFGTLMTRSQALWRRLCLGSGINISGRLCHVHQYPRMTSQRLGEHKKLVMFFVGKIVKYVAQSHQITLYVLIKYITINTDWHCGESEDGLLSLGLYHHVKSSPRYQTSRVVPTKLYTCQYQARFPEQEGR